MYRFVAILKILNWPLDDKDLHKIWMTTMFALGNSDLGE